MRFKPYFLRVCFATFFLCVGLFADVKSARIDQLLAKQNAKAENPIKKTKGIDDLTFLRRVSVDVIGRIPSYEEVKQFQKWPVNERRSKLIEIPQDRSVSQ